MTSIIIIIVLCILFDLLNGIRDAGNFVSTLISTRVLRRRTALILIAAAEFIAPLIFGTMVAATFGKSLVAREQLTFQVIAAALTGAILWNLITLWASIPASSTHSLVGGITGAVIAAGGLGALQTAGLVRVLLSLFLSPILGILFGYLATALYYYLSRDATPAANETFRVLQIPLAGLLAAAYGINDAQKSMAMITLGLMAAGQLAAFDVPTWVVLLSAGATAVGFLLSDQRVTHKLGSKFFRLKPIHGSGAQTGAAVVLLGSSLLGYPASSSQVITSAILGTGIADRINMVRWGVAWQIIQAWFIAIPVTGLLSAGAWWLLMQLPLL